MAPKNLELFQFGKFHARSRSNHNRAPTIDTFLATVLVLLVLEGALLPAESAGSAKDSIVSSIIRKWTRHSDN
jgi:hypothetical protein